MRAKTPAVALLVLSLAACLPTKSLADERCAGSDVTVASASASDRALICSGARQALDLLGRCAISPRYRIDIRVLGEVRHPFAGPIFGYYDLAEGHIALTDFGNLPALMQDTPYRRLPLSDFYKSLVVHEVVHSVMHQNLMRPASSQAAYEYPAYALQIMSLSPPVREQFLASFDPERIGRSIPFSDVVLSFDPYFFAARAYKHFKASSDGCAILRAVMTSEADFIRPH